MPLALDPKARITLVLDSDKDKPAAKQPGFVYAFLTGRRWRDVARAVDGFDEGDGMEAGLDRIYTAASVNLIGWRNLIDPQTGEEIPFDPANLEEILTPQEAIELANRLLTACKPDGADLKNSGSRSRTSSGKSAKSARRRKPAARGRRR